jgi:hypothetical protein
MSAATSNLHLWQKKNASKHSQVYLAGSNTTLIPLVIYYQMFYIFEATSNILFENLDAHYTMLILFLHYKFSDIYKKFGGSRVWTQGLSHIYLLGECSITWATPPLQTQSFTESFNTLKIEVFFTLSIQCDSSSWERYSQISAFPHFLVVVMVVLLGFELRTSSLLCVHLPLESYLKPLFFTYFSHRVIFCTG